jgi:hypothetical protein
MLVPLLLVVSCLHKARSATDTSVAAVPVITLRQYSEWSVDSPRFVLQGTSTRPNPETRWKHFVTGALL